MFWEDESRLAGVIVMVIVIVISLFRKIQVGLTGVPEESLSQVIHSINDTTYHSSRLTIKQTCRIKRKGNKSRVNGSARRVQVFSGAVCHVTVSRVLFARYIYIYIYFHRTSRAPLFRAPHSKLACPYGQFS